MYINKNSPIPVYYQLKKIILKKIENGEFDDGKSIPSERDLGQTLNISRMTVRQALNQLVTEGILYREKGKGTFVSKTKLEQKDIMSFSDMVKKKGLVPSTKILKFTKTLPEQEIAENLGIDISENIYDIKRLRLANELPVGIEEVFIPEKYCPQLEDHDLAASLYRLFNEQYSYVISHVDSLIESSKPSNEEKELLGITAGIPVLRINGIYYVRNEIKLFFERSAYRSDEFKYSVRVYTGRNME